MSRQGLQPAVVSACDWRPLGRRRCRERGSRSFAVAVDGLVVGLQLQLLEPEHLPVTLNTSTATGNTIRAGIEFEGAFLDVAQVALLFETGFIAAQGPFIFGTAIAGIV